MLTLFALEFPLFMLLKLLFKWSIYFIGKPKFSASKASAKPRVLLIPYNAIGDMVMTAPLFSALKQSYPDWQLEVLCSSRNHPLSPGGESLLAIRSWFKTAASACTTSFEKNAV
ncbi:MAG: glycosyltransferase family 9 protein [Vibrio fluvialis]